MSPVSTTSVTSPASTDLAKRERCIAYLRVSTSAQDVANQHAELKQIIAQRNLFLVAVVEETGSAVKHRPLLEKQVLGPARRGEVDVVLVWSLDRLARTMHDAIGLVMHLDRLGVAVVSAREPFLDVQGPARSLLVAILGWVGDMERRRIVERTQAGLERARKKGIRLGRPPVDVDLVKLRTMHSQGCSVRVIAKALGIGATTAHRLITSSCTVDREQLDEACSEIVVAES